MAAQPGVRAIRNLAAATQACKAFQQAAGGLAALALRAIAQDQHDDLRVTTKPVMSHFGSHEFILYWIQLIDEEGRRRYDRPGWLTCTRGRLPRPSWMSAPEKKATTRCTVVRARGTRDEGEGVCGPSIRRPSLNFVYIIYIQCGVIKMNDSCANHAMQIRASIYQLKLLNMAGGRCSLFAMLAR